MDVKTTTKSPQEITATLQAIITAILAVCLCRWLYMRHQSFQLFKRYGIPGPPPRFFTGNSKELKSGDTPNDAIAKWKLKYGNVFGYFIGHRPHMVVYDLDILKQVLIKDFQNFVNRPKMFIQARPIIYSLLGLRGERWKAVRKALTPTFSGYKIKQMAEIMNAKVDLFLDCIRKQSNCSAEFDVHKNIEALTLDVIGECVLAMRVNCQTNPNDPFLSAVTEYMHCCNNPAVELASILPVFARILEIINNHLTAGKLTSMVVNNVRHVIACRRSNPSIRGIDALQLMLDAEQDIKEDGESKRTILSNNEMEGNSYIFLLAGYETTATALAFAFYLLVKHPEIQEKLYQEVVQHLGDTVHPSYDDIQELEYLDKFFNETLRLYPPVTGFITRECQSDITINSQVIPKGVNVQVPVWDIHHDGSLWPDPWKFDPERFSSENKSLIHSVSFVPFGLGPRNCIGMRFAQLEAKLTLAQSVKNFRFIPSSKTEDIPLLDSPTEVIIRPLNGVFIKAVPR